jgi:shikimate dehydrogenase
MLVGLIGANITKSLAPALYADAFAVAKIDGYYHLMDVDWLPGRSLADLLAAVKAAGFIGTNVTFPFKEDVLSLIDIVDPEAREIGAVNTICITPDGRTAGYNTDKCGFRRSFEEGLGRASAEAATVVIVGAGGAGRAVAFALMELGAAKLILHDRESGQAAELAHDLASRYGEASCRLAENLDREIAAAEGVVNATPVGMHGVPGNPVPESALRPDHWAADVIYTPIETAFIKAAASKGARVLTGGGMCVNQAAEAFRLFTGIEPDVSRMHHAFDRALAARSADEETSRN